MGAARKLDQDQAAFEDKQLSSLESIAEREPAKLLDEAVKIKLIDQETRDKINTAIPGHEVLFTKTLEKAGTGPGAFKKAFRLVYGRFLMERESGTGKENAALISKLNSVLKFEVDEHIIKGRPELQAAARRLRTYAASRVKPTESAKFNLPITERRKEFLLRRKKTTERYVKDIQGVSDYVDSIGTSAEGNIDLNFLVQDVTKVESDIANLEADLNSIESGISVDKLSTDEVVNFFNLDPKFVFSLSEDQLNELSEEMKINTAFARKLLGIDFGATLDTNAVEKAHEKFMLVFDPNKFADRGKADIMTKVALNAKEALDDLISFGVVQPITDPFAERTSVLAQIEAKKKEKETLDVELKSGREKNSGPLEMLDGFEYGIDFLRKDVNISFAAKKLCDDYINSYQAFKRGSVLDDKKVIKKFLRNEVKDFVRRLKETLDENLGTYNKDIGVAQTEIDGFSVQLDDPEGIRGILEKAFPQSASGQELKRLERLLHDAEHHEHDVNDVYKYFSDRTNVTKVIEASKVVGDSIGEWNKDKKTKLDKFDEEIALLDEQIAALGDNALTALRSEMAELEIEKRKKESELSALDRSIAEIVGLVDPARKTQLETEKERLKGEREKTRQELEELSLKLGKIREGKDPDSLLKLESDKSKFSAKRKSIERDVRALDRKIKAVEVELAYAAVNEKDPENTKRLQAKRDVFEKDKRSKIDEIAELAIDTNVADSIMTEPLEGDELLELEAKKLVLEQQRDQGNIHLKDLSKQIRAVELEIRNSKSSEKKSELEARKNELVESEKEAKGAVLDLEAKMKVIEQKLNPSVKQDLELKRDNLLKEKAKIDLPLNARISYLTEQITLKGSATLSADQIQKRLTEGSKRSGYDTNKEKKKMDDENERITEEKAALKEELARLNSVLAKAKEFKDGLRALIENAVKAENVHIDLGAADHDHHFAAKLLAELQGINIENRNFMPSRLVDVYDKFRVVIEPDKKMDGLLAKFDKAMADHADTTKKSKKALDKATAASEKGKNLTDDQAAKKIIGAMVAEQFPDLSPTDHNKLVSMILADDVATLQTDGGYEALAQRGSAEKFETLKFAGFRAKLLDFKFKEGEKITQPFKGLKPDDFKDWASMEKLFLSGRLNYKNAFFVLAAFEEFDNGIKSIQSVQLEKKLKKLLAKEMNVDEHMDKAGISKIVDDAFKAQMEKVRPIMKAHSETVDSKGGKAKEHKKQVLDMKYEELNDQLRTKKIGQKDYDHKLEALVKEASEAEVEVEFSTDSAGAKFWNSPEAQWLKNKAYDTRTFLGKKALAIGVIAPFKIGMSGLWGGAKLGASLGFQTAMMPFRAAKYPLLLAAKPMVGAINLFRSNKWTPLPGIRDSIKNDAARVVGYTTETASGVVKGATETVTKTAGGEWDKVKFADVKYEDRNKEHADERAEMLKVHEPKSAIDPIEVAESPFISFDKYNKQIEMVSKALGITIHASGAHEVKVGHEEKVAEKKEEAGHPKHEAAHGAAPAAANDNHEKKHEAAHGSH